MKKNKIFNLSFLGAMTLAAFCACSSADDIVDVTDTESGSADGSMYLGVNISMTDGSTTRADDDDNYVNGDEDEYEVNSESSYFLFYDDEGNYMTYGTLTDVNWSTNTDDENVTSYAAVVSNMFDDEFPSKMIAVLNYNYDISNLKGLSISELENVTVSDTYGAAGKFTMSNAVTIDEEETEENTETKDFTYITKIDSTNFSTTIDGAAENSVDLYVEREIAKVVINISDENFTTGADTTTTLENIIYYAGESYKNTSPTLTLDGWGINATNSKGYLVKKTENLNVSDYTGEDASSWYNTNDHRFFWAEDINYTYSAEETEEEAETESEDETEDNDITYLAYSGVAALGLSTSAAYYHENTVDAAGQLAIEGGETATTPTLIVVGTITITEEEETTEGTTEAKTRDEEETTDSDEDPDLFYYAGVYYNTKGLLTAIYNSLGETYYTDASLSDELTVDDLTDYIVTFTSDGQGGAAIEGVYNNSTEVTVYNEDNTSGTNLDEILNSTHFIYDSDDSDSDDSTDDSSEDSSDDTKTSHTSYYKNGKCYYQKPIVHLDLTDESEDSESTESEEETEEVEKWYGIVRNHYYNITLNSITSIGGPVSGEDDELTIIPGEDENYYIQADINILSWREVDQTVDF